VKLVEFVGKEEESGESRMESRTSDWFDGSRLSPLESLSSSVEHGLFFLQIREIGGIRGLYVHSLNFVSLAVTNTKGAPGGAPDKPSYINFAIIRNNSSHWRIWF
jgi:hypothetical protein